MAAERLLKEKAATGVCNARVGEDAELGTESIVRAAAIRGVAASHGGCPEEHVDRMDGPAHRKLQELHVVILHTLVSL